jgi:DNA-directed RNA polymerase subunit RPC12/RpoP
MKEDIYGKAIMCCSRCGKEYDIKPPPSPLDPVSFQKYEEDVWVYIPDKGYHCPDCYKEVSSEQEELDKLRKAQ